MGRILHVGSIRLNKQNPLAVRAPRRLLKIDIAPLRVVAPIESVARLPRSRTNRSLPRFSRISIPSGDSIGSTRAPDGSSDSRPRRSPDSTSKHHPDRPIPDLCTVSAAPRIRNCPATSPRQTSCREAPPAHKSPATAAPPTSCQPASSVACAHTLPRPHSTKPPQATRPQTTNSHQPVPNCILNHIIKKRIENHQEPTRAPGHPDSDIRQLHEATPPDPNSIPATPAHPTDVLRPSLRHSHRKISRRVASPGYFHQHKP